MRPKKYIPPIDEIEKIRSRRRKNPTVCSDQRRQFGHCGICGYEDMVFQGVDHCTVCGKEKEVLFLRTFWSFWNKDMMKCHKRDDSYKHTAVERFGIFICLACGAIKAPKCPNCGRNLWKKDLQRYCKHCGFRV